MKIDKALEIINSSPKNIKPTKKGYMVSFETKEGGMLKSDHFPDKHDGEPLIETKYEAWDLAQRFANATNDNTVNIYVIDSNFYPVENYQYNMLKPYKR